MPLIDMLTAELEIEYVLTLTKVRFLSDSPCGWLNSSQKMLLKESSSEPCWCSLWFLVTFFLFFWSLRTKLSLLKCHSLHEYCCWPCTSHYNHCIATFWRLLSSRIMRPVSWSMWVAALLFLSPGGSWPLHLSGGVRSHQPAGSNEPPSV